MRLRFRFLCFLVFLLWFSTPCAAQPDSESQAEGASLVGLIEAYEKGELELARAREELKSAKAPSRIRPIEESIRKLELQQERLAQSIEKLIGPLPPKVVEEQPTSLERQMESQEQRHETTLESDVEKRLR